ncbi:MAG: glycosyl transferase [Desulfobacterales bacterium]|nr:glycosyl transferase [Desulfobacterales bacterium]
MRIVFYCQYVWGMGHLFRSLELARALAGHRVTLVAGGPEVAVDPPGHVELVRLPGLHMDEQFTTLLAGASGASVAALQQARAAALAEVFERVRPQVFIVELYPFGRTAFGFELEPLLEAVRQGRYGPVRTVCSLRDVLVEKRDPAAYEERVLEALHRWFDLLLIHSDERLLPLGETFSRFEEIRIPKVHTGFVAARPDPENGRRLRGGLGLAPDEKLVIASCGGGRSGYRLIQAVLQAFRRLRGRAVHLEAFCGPFMNAAEYDELHALRGAGMNVRRFTPRLIDHLAVADLSISLAGYNTCMNLLATGVPALVLPYSRQREQPLRVEKLKPYLPIDVLDEGDLDPECLARAVERGLCVRRSAAVSGLNLDGAATAARLLEEWAAAASPPSGAPACDRPAADPRSQEERTP